MRPIESTVNMLVPHLMRGADFYERHGHPWWMFPLRAYLFCIFAFIVFLTIPYRSIWREPTQAEMDEFGIDKPYKDGSKW